MENIFICQAFTLHEHPGEIRKMLKSILPSILKSKYEVNAPAVIGIGI